MFVRLAPTTHEVVRAAYNAGLEVATARGRVFVAGAMEIRGGAAFPLGDDFSPEEIQVVWLLRDHLKG